MPTDDLQFHQVLLYTYGGAIKWKSFVIKNLFAVGGKQRII